MFCGMGEKRKEEKKQHAIPMPLLFVWPGLSQDVWEREEKGKQSVFYATRNAGAVPDQPDLPSVHASAVHLPDIIDQVK